MDQEKSLSPESLIPSEVIENRIYLIRGQRIMLDRDLAVLYGVETRALNQAVKRNCESFPEDFMFALTRVEILRLSQFVITSELKYSPSVFAFTEHGILMLSSVLKSSRARLVNIQIMRTFVRLKQLVASNSELGRKFDELEKSVTGKLSEQDKQIQLIFNTVRQLLEPPVASPMKIGFRKN